MPVTEPDRRFIEDLEATRLAPGCFDHRGHLRAAWILYRVYDRFEAERRFIEALRRFARHVGQPGKYHHTLTLALLAIIRSRMAEETTFAGFEARNRDLVEDAFTVLSRYYSPGRIGDPAARTTFLEPDRALLPEAATPDHPDRSTGTGAG